MSCPTQKIVVTLKQEAIEDVAKKYSEQFYSDAYSDFLAGAKYQAERMYNYEDLKEAWEESENNYTGLEFGRNRFTEWFNNF